MTDQERVRHVLSRFAAVRAGTPVAIGTALCATSVDVLELPGAGITLQVAAGDQISVGVSTPDMATLHALERTLGEGPCVDAFTRGTPILEPDLASPRSPRWIAFTAGALETEARAAFGFPLRVGTTSFGALNLYATEPGELTDEQYRNAVVVADVATHAVLADAGGEDELLDVGDNQLEVHQAAGMVSVQLSVGVADALARLRAHAFVEGRPISAVAADVVGRHLRFEA